MPVVTLPPNHALPPPGAPGSLVVVAMFEGEQVPSEADLRDPALRPFDAWCAFAKSAEWPDVVRASVERGDGISYLRTDPTVSALEIATPYGCLRLYPNANHEIGSGAVRVMAGAREDAMSLLMRAVGPVIDRIAFDTRTPIIISRLACWDEKHRAWSSSFTSPYGPCDLGSGHVVVHEELVPVLALYREAKSSASPFYSFLCYFKILEAVFKHIEPRIRREARERGIVLNLEADVLGDHFEFRFFGEQYRGRRIRELFDGDLRRAYRNAIAHFAADGREPLNLSDYKTMQRFQDIAFVAELCCRTVVKKQMESLTVLRGQRPTSADTGGERS